MTATALATKSDIDLRPAEHPREPADTARQLNYITVLAIFDGSRWSALCRELDITSDGDNAFEAIIACRNAVMEAKVVAAEQHIAAGKPVTVEQLTEFLSSHVGPEPLTSQIFVGD